MKQFYYGVVSLIFLLFILFKESVKPPEEMPEVVDDFDIGEEEEVAVENRCLVCS